MEESNKNKKQFILSLFCISLLILFSIGMVYAFFNYTRTGERNNVLNTASLNFSFEDSEWIWLENAYPLSTTQALSLEVTDNSDILEVDGGIAQFKVEGGHESGAIHYMLSLVKENINDTVSSKNNRFTLDPSTKTGQLPDGAISINLQTSISDIFETIGLVNDTMNLVYPGKSFEGSYTGSYVNTNNSVSIDKLPFVSTNERSLGTGIMSGAVGSRYFELRMWINDMVMINDNLRIACKNNNSDESTYGQGYCNPTTENLPTGIRYVYSSGEFSKLYYSNKIRIQITNIANEVIEPIIPPITQTLKQATTPKDDNTISSFTNNITEAGTGLFVMNSTKNTEYPIYYFRGDVQNNYLSFGGFCWRIVRTTETGGTKLIYEQDASTTACNNRYNTLYGFFNSSHNSPAYLGFKYGSDFVEKLSKTNTEMNSLGTIKYGKNVIYENGQYRLTDSISANYETDYSDDSPNSMKYHHYTCFTNSTSCETVNYVYYISSSLYYYPLSDGKTHMQLLNELLGDNDGAIPSIAYTELSGFYTKNLLSYANYLEDTVFCNDRTVFNYGGWDINKSNYAGEGVLYFNSYNRIDNLHIPSLICENNNDKFTVGSSLGNGKLEYPIGLLTADEYMFAGAESNSIYYLSSQYAMGNRSMTPASFGWWNYVYNLSSAGSGDLYVDSIGSLPDDFYITPVISLSKDVIISGGNGTVTNPYTVSLPN